MTKTISSDPRAIRYLHKAINAQLTQIFRPTPRISGSEWANTFRMLSAETATEPGPYQWERAPYQQEWLDVMCDSKTQKVVLMTAARVGKTTVLENVTGFYMHQNPAAIMWMLPTLGEAEKFSQSNIDPMIRDCAVLRELVKDKRQRDSGNQKLRKAYKGGSLSLVGGESATQLHGKTVRVLLADEVDRLPYSAGGKNGGDGDPLSLAMVRATTFGRRRKIILSSTPTVKDLSHIETEFLESDQRYYHVPCPHCNHFQKLLWGQLLYRDDPEHPEYVCIECAATIQEHQKFRMLQRGKWIAENPTSRVAGFHINTLYSVHMTWAELVSEWQRAKGNRFKLQVFVNSRLAETWDESGDRVNAHQLEKRLEQYNADVPTKDEHCNGVGVLSCGADVQGNRIECSVYGIGANDELWLVDTEIFDGDTGTDAPWNAFESFLMTKRYRNKHGGTMGIRAIAIDSGYNTERTYRFVQRLKQIDTANRTIIATKGQDTFARFVDSRASQSKQHNALFYKVGTNIAKEHLSKLMANADAGPQYLHLPVAFPSEGTDRRWMDREVLAQLTSEKQVLSYKGGKVKREWKKTRERNEQWDMFILAYAAFLHLGPNVLTDMPTLVDKVAELQGAATPAHTAPLTPPPSTAPSVAGRLQQAGIRMHGRQEGFNQQFWRR